MNRDFIDRLAKQLGISPEDQAILDAGSNHVYTCKCETCRQWWKQMGPDPDTEKYGPFTAEEINRA